MSTLKNPKRTRDSRTGLQKRVILNSERWDMVVMGGLEPPTPAL